MMNVCKSNLVLICDSQMITVGEFKHSNLSTDSPLRTYVLYQIDL